jgi:hypothetical protein
MAGLFLLNREADFIPACCICITPHPFVSRLGRAGVSLAWACFVHVPACLRELLQVVCLVRLGGFRRWSIGPNYPTRDVEDTNSNGTLTGAAV